MKILIADSGNTKTDWAFIEDGKPIYHRGTGLHPAYSSDEMIRKEIGKTAGHLHPTAIRFYGTGCYSDVVKTRFKNIIRSHFGNVSINIYDDLTAAAHAHLGKKPGIIAILGTGSVCGRYDGNNISDRSAALGYATGDEGSAADLGRRILKQFFRNRFDKKTTEHVSGTLGKKTYPELMEWIYQSDNPGRQLASIAGKVLNRPLTNQLSTLISGAFSDFITGQLSMLQPDSEETIVFTGTVALHHQALLKNEMKKKGFHSVRFGEQVIEGLVQYYNNR